MKHLFQPITVEHIKQRIQQLKPTTERKWGKMSVSQMLAHCNASLEVATGEKNPPQLLLGRLIGRYFKSAFINDRPLRRNTPTEKSFIFPNDRNFDTEKQRLLEMVDRFAGGGESKVTKTPHSFFGPLTPDEWSKGMYKHLDHHLRQFGS